MNPNTRAASGRPVEIERIERFDDSLREALEALLPQLSPLPEGCDMTDRLRRTLSDPASTLLAARMGDRWVGTLTLAVYHTPSGTKAWIEDVVVDAPARRSGAAAALVRAALDRVAALGADTVRLTTAPHRMAARKLYTKEGFVEVETGVFARKLEPK